MKEKGRIACVTGASGVVGRRITARLLSEGYAVRALSRKSFFYDPCARLFTGSLGHMDVLEAFAEGADLMFHCAAELKDESRMQDVNVGGAENIVKVAARHHLRYFCHISSAGVVGKTKEKWVDEKTECDPQNFYEKTKFDAERMISRGIKGCRIIILRPTNVVDKGRPGALDFIFKKNFSSSLKAFIKGGERAHATHADDVARAALFFVQKKSIQNQVFLVSCDHDPLNTFSGIKALAKAIGNGASLDHVRPAPHLPPIFPYLIRLLKYRGKTNFGTVRYSSKKLLSHGFRFAHEIPEMVSDLMKAGGD